MIIAGVGAFMGVVANVTEMLLSRREQEIRSGKTHMVTSVFFSELGTELLRFVRAPRMLIPGSWKNSLVLTDGGARMNSKTLRPLPVGP